MTRWNRLRVLLLVTGVSSAVLFVSAEEVERIAGDSLVEAALTTGFAFSLIAFLLIGSVGLGKKTHRDARRIYDQRVAKCYICNEPLPEASLRQVGRLHSFHYQTVHIDAWKWIQKWRRIWVPTAVPSALLFVLGLYIALSGNYLGLLVVAIAMIPLLTLTRLRSLKLRQFRREWTEHRKEV